MISFWGAMNPLGVGQGTNTLSGSHVDVGPAGSLKDGIRIHRPLSQHKHFFNA